MLNYNPVIYNNIQVWRQITKQLKLRKLSLTLLISTNPSFTPSVIDGGFDRWKELDLYINGTYSSFQLLQEKYGRLKKDFFSFFRYLQK